MGRAIAHNFFLIVVDIRQIFHTILLEKTPIIASNHNFSALVLSKIKSQSLAT